VKVYTWVHQAFRMGGTGEYVATEVEEYGRILLPGGFAAIVVENPVKKLFHVFLEGCGALIKTGPDKRAIVLDAQVDAVNGDPLIMKRQIEQGIKDRDGAPVIPLLEFFSKFHGVDREKKRKGKHG
jgi:hypothetical protein